MSISIMTKTGPLPVPVQSGVNADLLNQVSFMQGAIQELRERMDAVEQSRATEENYGIVKLSGSSTVTQDMGLALSSKEKNPAVSGTMK